MTTDLRLHGLVGALVAAALALVLLPAHGDTPGWRETLSPTLPAPAGSWPVGIRHVRVETGHPDPWGPGRERELMVDLHYPATRDDHPLERYYVAQHMSELAMLAWAPLQERRWDVRPDEVNWLFRIHSHEWAPVAAGRFPTVVLSAPPGTMRSSYQGVAEELASHGYVVVSVDHPYDAPVVELFPTRRVVRAGDASRALDRTEADAARRDDLRDVLARLPDLDQEVARRATLARVALLGWIPGADRTPESGGPVIAAVADSLDALLEGAPAATLRSVLPLGDDPVVLAQVAAEIPRTRAALADALDPGRAAERHRQVRAQVVGFLDAKLRASS